MFRDETHKSGWEPPHCPNPTCQHHYSVAEWRFRRLGFYWRQTKPHRIQRFQCLHCRRSFSTQTFSTTYWLHRPGLLPQIFLLSANGMANRQIARFLACAPGTVDNQIARLGRHCMLMHRHLMRKASPFSDIAVDGLVTFEFSQYFPFEHLVAVDNETSFLIHFTDAPLRRSGRMTAFQKRRRQELEARLGKPDPRAVEKGMVELLRVATEGAEQAIVRSDEHRAYLRALRQVACDITHRRTSSRRKRDRHNELFEINSLDMFLRHSQANHRRETIAFSRRRQCSSERLAVFQVWKNYVKRRWEKRSRATPGMLVGVTDRVLTAAEVLGRRMFRSHVELPRSWAAYYERRVATPVLGVNRGLGVTLSA